MKKNNAFLVNALIWGILILLAGCNNHSNPLKVSSKFFTVTIQPDKEKLWSYEVAGSNEVFYIQGPVFEVDGEVLMPDLGPFKPHGFHELRNGTKEFMFQAPYQKMPDLHLSLFLWVSEESPVLRFRYQLETEGAHWLTKSQGKDQLTYLSADFERNFRFKEVRFSEFNEMIHSFQLDERNLDLRNVEGQRSFMGPLMMATNGECTGIIAYEHGSQVPDAYLGFGFSSGGLINLKALKGNYLNKQELDQNSPYSTLWFHFSAISGDESLMAEHYRNFVLRYMSENLESRKPYIFYNTWNFQERNKHWYRKPYLQDMNLPRMLKEIDAAASMGIDVFVIDAGWFEKTGDWQPDLQRFPDTLKQVNELLGNHGMKLGLWFNPTAAAATSEMYRKHADCVKSWDGKASEPYPVWETEASYNMCLVSRYREAFANELIRCARDYGVRYFKWDAIGQYGCNDPNHFHGNRQNDPAERAESFAFELSNSMSWVVQKLCDSFPDAIVDFDITEGGRAVGLGFLSAGKYFLINNGPYYMNYDIPFNRETENWNIFFYPGPARSWICRSPLTFDKWIPSVMFLTHYLPDDPEANQKISLASLMLGQNGIWGDLLSISPEGKKLIRTTLDAYKAVRDDITSSSLLRDGSVGGSPEIYEKIDPFTGKGIIVIFSSHHGEYTYTSKRKPLQTFLADPSMDITFDENGHAMIKAKFGAASAGFVLFGIEETGEK